MKETAINIGDRVLECTPWQPGVDYSHKKKRGEGIVTLIAKDETKEHRRVRVLWTSGTVEWHPENELVLTDRVF